MSSCPPYTNPPPTPYPRPKSYTKHWLPVGQKRFAHVSHMLGPGARGKLVEGTPCSSGFRGCSRSRVRVNTKLQGGHSSSLAQLIPGPSCWGFSEGLVRAVASSFAQVGRNSHMSRTCLEAGREGGEGGPEEALEGVCVCIRHEFHDLYELETRKARWNGGFSGLPQVTNFYELLRTLSAPSPGCRGRWPGQRDRGTPPGMSCTSYGGGAGAEGTRRNRRHFVVGFPTISCGAPKRRAPGVDLNFSLWYAGRSIGTPPMACSLRRDLGQPPPPEPASEAPPRTADDTGPRRQSPHPGHQCARRSAVSNPQGRFAFFSRRR